MIKYDPFFEYIRKKGLSQNQLIKDGIINPRLLNALKHNKSVTTDSLDKLCTKLNCNLNDILKYENKKINIIQDQNAKD